MAHQLKLSWVPHWMCQLSSFLQPHWTDRPMLQEFINHHEWRSKWHFDRRKRNWIWNPITVFEVDQNEFDPRNSLYRDPCLSWIVTVSNFYYEPKTSWKETHTVSRLQTDTEQHNTCNFCIICKQAIIRVSLTRNMLFIFIYLQNLWPIKVILPILLLRHNSALATFTLVLCFFPHLGPIWSHDWFD